VGSATAITTGTSMPRNKREQDREEKRELIIDAARQLFLDVGYEACSMSKLAASASIAPNTIYWYFKDKDDVLVAVLNRELSGRMAQYLQTSFTNTTERLLWVVNQLELASRLVSTVHARVQLSPAIHVWHEQFHALSEGMLRLEIQAMGVAADKIDPLLKIWVFTVEGLLSHPMDEQQKKNICTALTASYMA
jgi:AcrR family transcriptional regulator